MDLKGEIKTKLFTNTNKISPARIKQHKELYKKIYNQTTFLDSSATPSERIYCILNDIKERLLCPLTNKPLNWSPQRKEYRKVVGKENANRVSNKTEAIEKFKKTIHGKYKQNKEQFWHSYSTNNYKLFSKEELKQKCKDIITSNKSNYFRPSDLVEQKDLLCSIVHYTDKSFLKDKKESNWAERLYLIINDIPEPPACLDNPLAKQFFENTIKGYRKFSSNKRRILDYTKKNIIPNINAQGFELLTDVTGNLNTETHILKCTKCSSTHERKLFNGRWQNIYCEICYGKIGRSKEEQDLFDFIKISQSCAIQQYNYSQKHDKEIDIFIPTQKIGFEYNGYLWHSYGCNYPNNILSFDKKYHILEKQQEAKALGIQIYNIFDYEWINKPEIIKSIINSKLNIYQHKIYARRCEVRELEAHVSNEFLNNNHLQGADNSKYKFGLFYNNALVAVMTFSDRHITRGQTSLELVRFCCLLNISVIGGASKLFKAFVKKYKPLNIITYADKRYSNGNLYANLGFKLLRESKPNYFYIKGNKIESRIKYQKHKLPQSLETFDNSKTELQNMWDNGYRILYDCGNFVFKWSNH